MPPELGHPSAQVSCTIAGVESLAQAVGDGVGGSDGLSADLDLDGAVTASCLDEFPGQPAG